MTTLIFTNNLETKLVGDITTAQTVLFVEDASKFNEIIHDSNAAYYKHHEMATIDNGSQIEIVKVTGVDTAANSITVVRQQEDTAPFAFTSGTKIEGNFTAEAANGGWYGRDWGWYAGNQGDYSIDLVTRRSSESHAARSFASIAMGYYVGVGDGSSAGIAIGYGSTIGDNSPYSMVSGYYSSIYANTPNSIVSGVYCYCEAEYGYAAGFGAAVSGLNSLAIGRYPEALGVSDVAIGDNARTYAAAFTGAIAIGNDSYVRVDGEKGMAFGDGSEVFLKNGMAFGTDIISRLSDVRVMGGISGVNRDSGETDSVHFFSGQENVIVSDVVILKAGGSPAVNIPLPAGGSFYLSEVGLIIVEGEGITSQPTVSFGGAAGAASILAATPTVANTPKDRDRFTTLATNKGQTVLTMDVTVVAIGTALTGRAYFKGIYIEDQ